MYYLNIDAISTAHQEVRDKLSEARATRQRSGVITVVERGQNEGTRGKSEGRRYEGPGIISLVRE